MQIFRHVDSDRDILEIDYYREEGFHPFVLAVVQHGAHNNVSMDRTALRKLRDALNVVLNETDPAALGKKADEPESENEGLPYLTAKEVDARISAAFAMLAGRANDHFNSCPEVEETIATVTRDLAEQVAQGMRELSYERQGS